MTSKPHVVVIATGGTIAGLGTDPMDVFNYGSAGRFMKGDEMIARIEGLDTIADIEIIAYSNVASVDLGPRHWLELIGIIHDAVERNAGITGIVVTHGTSSLEETAYFLNLTLKIDCPVVIVGSQRPASAIGTDAALNLVNAIRVAADPTSSGMGVLVVLNGEINAARDVAKTSTFRSQAFQSQDLGLLGYVDGDAVTFYRSPLRRHYPQTEFEVTGQTRLPRVDIVATYAGADGVFVDAAIAAGCAGIVAAGMAPGAVTHDQEASYDKAREKGIVVVISSRSSSGRITAARHAIAEAGMIPADTLTPQKARLLLMLALTKTSDVREIARMFGVY